MSRNYIDRQSEPIAQATEEFTLLRKFNYQGEGDMVLTHAFSARSVVGSTALFCMTHRGVGRLLDLRMKGEASTLPVGPEHGLPSALCTDRYENVMFVGTLGGYIQLVDLRFQLVDEFFHWGRSESSRPEAVPIFSLASFQPDHT